VWCSQTSGCQPLTSGLQALECYTSALNCTPGDARLLSNRAACHAALSNHAAALADSQAAAACDPGFAKAHSRAGAALLALHRYDEAAEAFQAALALDGSSESARDGLTKAQQAGGEAQRAAAARAVSVAAGRATIPVPPPPMVTRAGDQARAAARQARAMEALQEHQETLARLGRQRRAAIVLWRTSTGTELLRPAVVGNRSIHVDVFGRLRGACAASGCPMWRRDVTSARGWSDTSILTCEGCGGGSDAHADCGPYEIEDPPAPGRGEALQGVHQPAC